MSAKKAWDIRPNPRRKVSIARDPVLVRAKGAGVSIKTAPLKERRRTARQRLATLLAILALALVSGTLYILWRPELRIVHIEASGPHADALPVLAESALQGTYGYLLPKNSIVFVPEEAMRNAILNAYPDIAAVSISRTSFNSLFVEAFPRVLAFTWCGASVASSTGSGSCYEADAEGFIFAPVQIAFTDTSTSTDASSTTFHVYAPLVGATPTSPIRAQVASASVIPDALKFVRAIESLGAYVASLQIRGDEADVYLQSGTRITYILGQENAAAALAAAAFPQLNVNDGSLDYVDLRFDGKVYFKKKGG